MAPYHLRLDWLMWFAALSPGYASGWFDPFIVKLLEGDRSTLKLLRHNPFPDAPPAWIRARFFRYRFTTRRERKQTGAVSTRFAAEHAQCRQPCSFFNGNRRSRVEDRGLRSCA